MGHLRHSSTHFVSAFAAIHGFWVKGQKLCDVTIVADRGKTRILAHKVVLAAASTFMRKIFLDSPATTVTISNDIAPEALRQLVAFAYTAKLFVDERNVVSLLRATEALGFPEAEKLCLEAIGNRLDVAKIADLDLNCVLKILGDNSLERKGAGFLPRIRGGGGGGGRQFVLLRRFSPLPTSCVVEPQFDASGQRKPTIMLSDSVPQVGANTVVGLHINTEESRLKNQNSEVVESAEDVVTITAADEAATLESETEGAATLQPPSQPPLGVSARRDISSFPQSKDKSEFEHKVRMLQEYEEKLSPSGRASMDAWQKEPLKRQNIVCAYCESSCSGVFNDFMEHIWNFHEAGEQEQSKRKERIEQEQPASNERTRIVKSTNENPEAKMTKMCPQKKVCRQCGHKFRRTYNLRMHIKYIHEGHTLTCEECGRTNFATKKTLRDHLENVHTLAEPRKCPQCNKFFKNGRTLKAHSRCTHEKLRFACESCGEGFASRARLDAHVNRVHLGLKEPPKPCALCGKLYTKQAMRTHRRRDHEGLRFACSACPATAAFSTHAALVRHREVFHQKRRFRCTICQAEFADRSTWKSHHESEHMGKRYPCKLCDKLFKRLGDLPRHMKEVHQGRRYQCQFCDKNFSQEYKLKLHIKSCHYGRFPHNCSSCSKGFLRPGALKDHMIKKHQMVVETKKRENLIILKKAG